MPNIQPQTSDVLHVNGFPVRLKRPMAYYAANRLQAIIPQITALNAAGKSQADACEALGVSLHSLRTWLELTGIEWRNLKRRGKYNIRNRSK